MNQRIDQLWAQALDAAVPETYTRLSHSQVLKIKQVFAELIVRECINCVRGAVLTDEVAVKNNLGFNDGLSAAVVNVQKHFGVKE